MLGMQKDTMDAFSIELCQLALEIALYRLQYVSHKGHDSQ